MARKAKSRKSEASRPRNRRILVVDDAEGIRGYLANLLELRGYDVDTAEDGRSALALLEAGAAPDAVLLDVMMPGIDGFETLAGMRKFDDELPVVMLTVVGSASAIVQAMQAGAADYLNKPFEEEELDRVLAAVFEKRTSEEERERLLEQIENPAGNFVANSEPMQRIREAIDHIADTNVTVLIQGESGVGKEIIARRVHSTSSRSKQPFVKVNCAALPDELLESELFGYEKGAFTGAVGRKQGKFELANRGTLFLDEIGEMAAGLQAKLLHVLQDGTFAKLGGNQEVQVDVRVVCATNRGLEDMVKQGSFREDLYYRLNVVNIGIPPLRDRREEVMELAETFLRRYSAKYRRPYRALSAQLQSAFARYAFPGNVRELENMIKRMVVLESETTVLERIFNRGPEAEGDGASTNFEALLEEVTETAGQVPLREVGRRAAQEAERETIERVLYRTNWNRKQAAKLLSVSYKTLLQKIRDCGLEPA